MAIHNSKCPSHIQVLSQEEKRIKPFLLSAILKIITFSSIYPNSTIYLIYFIILKQILSGDSHIQNVFLYIMKNNIISIQASVD